MISGLDNEVSIACRRSALQHRGDSSAVGHGPEGTLVDVEDEIA
jgi:hypothetical protein